MADPGISDVMARSERQRIIEKNVEGAMMLAFYAYIDPDRKRGQKSIDVVNKVMDACGYPRVPDITLPADAEEYRDPLSRRCAESSGKPSANDTPMSDEIPQPSGERPDGKAVRRDDPCEGEPTPRQPQIHRPCGMGDAPGLSDVMAGVRYVRVGSDHFQRVGILPGPSPCGTVVEVVPKAKVERLREYIIEAHTYLGRGEYMRALNHLDAALSDSPPSDLTAPRSDTGIDTDAGGEQC